MGDKKRQERRGRSTKNVNLGLVKPNSVKLIVDSLIVSNLLEESIIKQINIIYEKILWNNISSVEKGFRKIMILLNHGV